MNYEGVKECLLYTNNSRLVYDVLIRIKNRSIFIFTCINIIYLTNNIQNHIISHMLLYSTIKLSNYLEFRYYSHLVK